MFESEFERRVARALRVTPATRDSRAKQAIMERIRKDAVLSRDVRPLIGRGTRNSLIGLALAAGIGSVTTVSALSGVPHPDAAGATSTVIGDSVVSRVRDTLRLVRLIFDAPAARSVAVVGDFNAWNRVATPMKRDDTSGKWAVTLALHDGHYRYAIVVDNTRWPSASSRRAESTDSSTYALLHVAPANN